MGLTPVNPGELAAVVTTLEMRKRPSLTVIPASPLALARWPAPALDKYRQLFRRIGAPWLWFSRLIMDDAALATIIHDEGVDIYAVVDRRGIEVGILELDFRQPAACELGFFGLVPELGGKGHGRWLMAHALNLSWRAGIERVWVHTCTLDSPSALGFYQRNGFTPYERSVETFADPRLIGILPPDSAPHIPLLCAADS
ncbi:MAG: GNAT family N-acetyltransferase [Sphingomonadaceae bacterium]